jgi:CubicO group peptidase (beta-lactamase class C family)
VTGETLREFSDKEIFKPLGMQQSFLMDNHKEVVANRADGYTAIEGGQFQRFVTNLDWVGDGGLHTSLDDFIKWDQNFYNNQLGQKTDSFIEMLESPPDFFDGTPAADTFPSGPFSPYAWGMFMMEYRGLKAVGHTGGWVGYRSYYVRYPEVQLSFVILCNADAKSRTAQRINAIRDGYLDVLSVMP